MPPPLRFFVCWRHTQRLHTQLWPATCRFFSEHRFSAVCCRESTRSAPPSSITQSSGARRRVQTLRSSLNIHRVLLEMRHNKNLKNVESIWLSSSNSLDRLLYKLYNCSTISVKPVGKRRRDEAAIRKRVCFVCVYLAARGRREYSNLAVKIVCLSYFESIILLISIIFIDQILVNIRNAFEEQKVVIRSKN